MMMDNRTHILMYCGHTLTCKRKSGIQRVVVEAARALSEVAKIELVKWDELDGQLRYLANKEIDQIFGLDRPDAIASNRNCAQVNYRFGETLQIPESTWILFPEIPYHQNHGNANFSKIISQARTYGIRVGCIFYDLIPVRESDYSAQKSSHIEYLIEMLRCDRIFTISRYAASDLLEFYSSALPSDQAKAISEKVIPLALGECRDSPEIVASEVVAQIESRIVLLGTVEPRKQQTRFLRVFNDLVAKEPSLGNCTIDVFGSLHPLSANDFHRELRRNPRIQYHNYASDALVRESLKKAAFSVFISRNEGYGLPIVESLNIGTPCLTSDYGAMAEVATGGGCFLVDTLSDAEIANAILKLLGNSEILNQLRNEALKRKKRTWSSYAIDLIGFIGGSNEKVANHEVNQLVHSISSVETEVAFTICGVEWLVKCASFTNLIKEPPKKGKRILYRVDWRAEQLESLTGDQLLALCNGDVLVFSEKDVYDRFPELLRMHDVQALPSMHVGLIKEGDVIASWVFNAVTQLSKHTYVLDEIAQQEECLAHAARVFKNELPQQECELAIVISTFNRARFSELNVKWLMDKTKKYGSRVHVVVVDNASTDDTFERLSAFQTYKNFTLKVNSSNTGMLGNLHVCSKLQIAKHIWMIGDDDFIHDRAISNVLHVIHENPRVPLISTNFSVYYRRMMAERDRPDFYIGEGVDMARSAPSDGLMEIIQMAHIHDNLFTAIYPLILRADLLAACFNCLFDGEPFGTLTESVPTTKYILEQLASCRGYWLEQVGITANAHNSWTRHRPRWHSVLVPQMLELAKDAGLSSEVAWRWLNIHMPLFDEAIVEAEKNEWAVYLTNEEAKEASWLFRREIRLPDGAVEYKPGKPQLFMRR